MLHQKITIEEESTFPLFSSYEEASAFFIAKYGEDFILKSAQEIEGEKVYVYILVVDREAYEEGQKKLARFEIIKGTEFTDSFQSIGISENGDLFIAY
ncbi:hypothetical protein [Peribacillus sp. SCS-155]|uniref:hypothetical protein n=1 Tax=Peribacillus sedimenti TaxID=3115297 RepID=UPI003906791F